MLKADRVNEAESAARYSWTVSQPWTRKGAATSKAAARER
jgi:hypothetical protein